MKEKPFVISVSSRALFDLEEENKIFLDFGSKAFEDWQVKNQHKVLKPGAAFPLIKKILAINEVLPENKRKFKVVLVSRNSCEAGIRILNSIEHFQLPIETTVFTSGKSVAPYISAAQVDLMLSSNPNEVRKAIDSGISAAEIIPMRGTHKDNQQIKIAFDGDAVIFGDEAEAVFKDNGLSGFREHEVKNAKVPLSKGPMANLLNVIHDIQELFPDRESCPFRTALVTARGFQAIERPINTLKEWGVRIDETITCAGDEKGPFLKAFGADIFFDDSRRNIENSYQHNISSAHVPYGIRNKCGENEDNFTGSKNLTDSSKKVRFKK